ncbi:MAG TPA: FG-GAP-like repeat-containing protein [Candidatus Hydrogenedentes bacterium]|nr:FG-GAP-like repeat-containing protein [Candidatus Hydrogenedentota bacterium]HPG65990.1 FG-GAP-like repeat-containing protein [Candidatus Hydrogenedentota bacterium]
MKGTSTIAALCAVLFGMAWADAPRPPQPVLRATYPAGSRVYSSAVVADFCEAPGLEVLLESSEERKLVCLGAEGVERWACADFTLRLTATPTAGDLDGDGKPEILVTTRNDGVVCLGGDGVVRWKAPIEEGIPWGNATIADADADGQPEIYWISTSAQLERRAGDGTLVWRRAMPRPGPEGPVAVGDVNGDGLGEMVFGGGSHAVFCVDRDGRDVWTFRGAGTFNNGPVIADITGSPACEVFVASDDGVFYCLDGTTGACRWNHRTFPGRIDTAIAVGDIDRDGHREVLYGDGGGRLYCLDYLGEERWCFVAGDWIESAPALGDVDGDGEAEVVFGAANGNVCCLSSSGALEWTFAIQSRIAASPTLCDFHQDGHVEILVPAHDGNLYCLTCGGPWQPERILWPCRRYDMNQTGYLPAK